MALTKIFFLNSHGFDTENLDFFSAEKNSKFFWCQKWFFSRRQKEVRSDPSYEQRLGWQKLQSVTIHHSKIDVVGKGMPKVDNL